jgi:hypothetical protein
MNSRPISQLPATAILWAALLLPVGVIVGCQEEGSAPQPSAPARGTQAPVVQANAATVQGSLDVVGSTAIEGWAMDTTKPTNPVTVDLYDGDALLASVPAKVFRQDLLAAGRGDGNHGFAFPVPPGLKDGKPHTIHAKCAGVELSNSPKTFPPS